MGLDLAVEVDVQFLGLREDVPRVLGFLSRDRVDDIDVGVVSLREFETVLRGPGRTVTAVDSNEESCELG